MDPNNQNYDTGNQKQGHYFPTANDIQKSARRKSSAISGNDIFNSQNKPSYENYETANIMK